MTEWFLCTLSFRWNYVLKENLKMYYSYVLLLRWNNLCLYSAFLTLTFINQFDWFKQTGLFQCVGGGGTQICARYYVLEKVFDGKLMNKKELSFSSGVLLFLFCFYHNVIMFSNVNFHYINSDYWPFYMFLLNCFHEKLLCENISENTQLLWLVAFIQGGNVQHIHNPSNYFR